MSKLHGIKTKRILLFICIGLPILYYFMDDCSIGIDLNWLFAKSVTEESKQIKCYDYSTLNMLEELTPETEVPVNTSIFFVETSCHDNYLKLNSRQACAVESAAKMNPHSNVYLLFPSPISEAKYLQEQVELLKSYDNVKLMYINTKTFFDGTPLEQWYKTGKIKSSYYPLSHMSDILRYVILWKYGGIYLDLDVVVLRSFETMTNFAGAETVNAVAAGVLSFSHNHEVAKLAVEDIRNNFKGYDWGWNGPGVITRVLKKYCNVCKVVDMLDGKCKDFVVLPPSAFYPIPWQQWTKYFTTDEDVRDYVMEKIMNSYAIHVWNYHSIGRNVTIGSQQPYGLVAREQCPKVYSSLKDVF